MAVQAQYPSSILFLNRDMQEAKNTLGNGYSLQPQPGGGGGGGSGSGGELFDQTHMLLNPGVATNNSRKRSREMMTITAATMNSNPLISVALQQQQQQPPPPQVIDLSQLHTPQSNVVSTGLRLAFGDHHHHRSQQQQQQQHSLSPQSSLQSSVLLSMLSDDLASHIKQQNEEIDNLIHIQGEQLRRALAEKRQRNYRELLGTAEEAVARRLKEKEMEVEKEVRRNSELEARAAQLSAEAQVWQARSRAQESKVATLQAQLQQAMMRTNCGGSGCSVQQLQDRDEWGNAVQVVAEDAESAFIDPDRVSELTGPSCKACRKRVASVVLLPCRHMCLCPQCDAVAQTCPLCFLFRSSSVEVILC